MIIGPSEAGKRSGIPRAAKVRRRNQTVLALRAMGKTIPQIAEKLGVTPRAVYMGLRKYGVPNGKRGSAVDDAVALMQEELILQNPVTAEDLHTRLSEMWHADIADIIEPPLLDDGTANPNAGKYRPIHYWPSIWRKMLSGLDVKELFERSQDGGDSSWDQVGQVLKIKFADTLKIAELLGKHKAVDGFTREKSGDVNIMVVTADQARQVAGARRRLELVSSSVVDAESTT